MATTGDALASEFLVVAQPGIKQAIAMRRVGNFMNVLFNVAAASTPELAGTLRTLRTLAPGALQECVNNVEAVSIDHALSGLSGFGRSGAYVCVA